MTTHHADIGAVAIGRNEGARLEACLASLTGQVARIVYVDSGSTDGSVDMARRKGVEVVELDMSVPFTAARARNAGAARLVGIAPGITHVQFLDGDCEVVAGWFDAARSVLDSEEDVAVVCGRRREKHPEATVWNAMIDREWGATRPGEVRTCGGDALIRRAAFDAVGGYREDMIAGEEPEMCYRMRQKGWKVCRIAAEMTRHDAAMTRLTEWWQRARRAGHTYAEGAALYGSGPERYKVAELRRAVIWGIVLPVATVAATFVFGGLGLLLLLAWPLQALRLRLRGLPWADAVFLTTGKLAEAQGALGYWTGRLRGRRHTLIEYK